MRNKKRRTWKSWIGWGSSLIFIAIFLVVGFWRPGIFRGRPNDGHQLGGDLMSDLSGNTIECFIRGIETYESRDSWKYAECDIRETKDHQLVVFHDWDISALENSTENKAALGENLGHQAINCLSLSQIRGLRLNCGSQIPTLKQVLEKAATLKIQKPLLLEFKHLHSDSAREELLELAMKYRDQHDLDIHFLSFIRNVEICFPNADQWMQRFADNGFRVYQVYRPKTAEYDMCRWWNR